MTKPPQLPKVYVVAPTYREPRAVEGLRDCFRCIKYPRYELLIVNSNPGDETSRLLARDTLDGRLRELRGHPSLFWSGTQNVGLRWLKERAGAGDLVLLMNVDVGFKEDIITQLVAASASMPNHQIGAVAHSGGIVISSGVRVRSWLLAWNRHPLAGWPLAEVPAGQCEPMDFLPTRCVLFPVRALDGAGLIAEKYLPHYCADYEFTSRLRRFGYPPILCTDIRVECDLKNTGNDLYLQRTNVIQRLRNLTSIKSPHNLRYRMEYVRLAYPAYAVPTALAAYLGKTVVEVLLGGQRLRRLLPGKDRSFS